MLSNRYQVLPRQAAEKRCNDCPLGSGDTEHHYSMHGCWLKLLQTCLNDKIDSREYVRDALELLREHMDELRVPELGAESR